MKGTEVWLVMLLTLACSLPLWSQGGKVLNNFVTELLNISPPADGRPHSYRFFHPRDGWLFLRTAAKVKVGGRVELRLDGSELVFHDSKSPSTLETFRWLRAGEHELRVEVEGNGRLERLVVRSIPEILFAKFGYNPWVSRFGPYDWSFLQRYILPHITTIIGTGRKEDIEFVQEWKATGRKWIVECGVPGLHDKGEKPTLSEEEAFAYWAKNPGFQDPLLDGVIADEFLDARVNYPVWTAAIQRLSREFPGRLFYPYLGTSGKWFYTAEPGIAFVKAILQAGFKLSWERYLPEQATEEEAREFIRHHLKQAVEAWAQSVPEFQKHLIICLGVFSCFPLTLSHDPGVDFKVHLDLQMHHLATDPTFVGIYGVMGWTSGYMDEETLRWLGMLYRHYCIEGERRPLSEIYRLRYRSMHLRNPDFAEGLEGWSVEQAEEGSLQVRKMEGYGWLQGRWPRTPKGDLFLWMKRSEKRPNRIAQTLEGLETGRLYSLKFVTADFQGLTQKKSQKELHALSVRLEGADVLSGFSEPVPTQTVQGQWLNFHWRVFRPKASKVRLILSDWVDEKEPGGPIGQELMLNFVEVQPYLAKEIPASGSH